MIFEFGSDGLMELSRPSSGSIRFWSAVAVGVPASDDGIASSATRCSYGWPPRNSELRAGLYAIAYVPSPPVPAALKPYVLPSVPAGTLKEPRYVRLDCCNNGWVEGVPPVLLTVTVTGVDVVILPAA